MTSPIDQGEALAALAASHLGDPITLVIADAIGTAPLDTIVGAFMPAGERWELATIISTALREHIQTNMEGERG